MPMYICLITMLAVVFHPLQLTINSMKLTLHCIFSHINNTYTIEFPLEHADGMYHSENHWQLPHVNISYILFTNREKDGIPLNQHCSSQCKWEHSHILYLPEVQCMCSLFFFLQNFCFSTKSRLHSGLICGVLPRFACTKASPGH